MNRLLVVLMLLTTASCVTTIRDRQRAYQDMKDHRNLNPCHGNRGGYNYGNKCY